LPIFFPFNSIKGIVGVYSLWNDECVDIVDQYNLTILN
jgi:hypothetical protein